MNHIFITLTFATACLISCNTGSQSETRSENDDWKIYYFEFDEVDHYSYSDYKEQLIEYGVESLELNSKERLLYEITQADIPEIMNDTNFIDQLEDLGYAKASIPKEKHEPLNDLFRKKGYDPNDSWYMCMPVYRDILILKKDNQISGIAKICFECDIIYTQGADVETDWFGPFQGYEKLHRLLYN